MEIRKYMKLTWLTCLLLAYACGNANQTTESRRTRVFTDMAGREVVIPDSIGSVFVDRHSTLMFYSLDTIRNINVGFRYNDGEKRFLRRSFYDNKPYVIEKGSHEEIIRLSPDIIIWSQQLSPDNVERAERLQQKLNIPVVFFDMDIHRYKDIMKSMGSLLGREAEADTIAGFISKYIDPLPQIISEIPDNEKKSIYYAEGMNGLSTDPKGSIHSLLIDLCGGRNVAQSIGVLPEKGMTSVSMEQVYNWNPDYILVWSGNFDGMDSYKEINSNPNWRQLDAVRNGNVYQVPWRPFGWIDRPPGMNRLIGYLWLANLLYPDRVDIDMCEVSREFFRKFYHYDMSREEALALMNPKPEMTL